VGVGADAGGVTAGGVVGVPVSGMCVTKR
jgi:hypothetical protein